MRTLSSAVQRYGVVHWFQFLERCSFLHDRSPQNGYQGRGVNSTPKSSKPGGPVYSDFVRTSHKGVVRKVSMCSSRPCSTGRQTEVTSLYVTNLFHLWTMKLIHFDAVSLFLLSFCAVSGVVCPFIQEKEDLKKKKKKCTECATSDSKWNFFGYLQYVHSSMAKLTRVSWRMTRVAIFHVQITFRRGMLQVSDRS